MSTPDKRLPPAVCIMGATGTGKTELAIQLLDHFDFEIINVDSAQVFRSMNIGTAKPDAKTLEKAPHRLLDFIDPANSYSAADFRRDALREMQEIREAGRIPLLVGGTMLYFKALLEGIADLPPADPVLRHKLDNIAREKGWDYMHSQLKRIDPVSAARIHPNDPQRLQRALEVYELTNIPLSIHHKLSQQDALPWRVLKFALIPRDREQLRERLALRFEQMLAEGLLEEVKQLYDRGDLDSNLPSVRCVGYRQVWELLDGKIDYNAMKKRAIVATRQLAKRQLTWLRSEQGIVQVYMEDDNLSLVKSRIRGFLIQ